MSTDALKELSSLCAQLRDAERELEDLASKVKDKEARIRALTEEDIPALMAELGVKKITLETGEVIKVELAVYAQIPAASKEAAFAWLIEHGHGGLIKTVVGVQFGREELEKAKAVAAGLVGQGLEPVLDQSVHASTLKAWIKERLAASDDIPLDMFGARPVNTAKIK